MAGQPKPWSWKERGSRYATIDGNRYRLADDKTKADREFYRLRADEGKLEGERRDELMVADAVESMLVALSPDPEAVTDGEHPGSHQCRAGRGKNPDCS